MTIIVTSKMKEITPGIISQERSVLAGPVVVFGSVVAPVKKIDKQWKQIEKIQSSLKF